jgi:AmmeMemoRadiSam system protein B/AmmeMemoRadiSam system protein A
LFSNSKILIYPLIAVTLLVSFDFGRGNQQEEIKMSEPKYPEPVRQPAVAGQFYTSDPLELRSEVKGYIQNAQEFPQYQPIALISPHAGYVYSGWVAGYSYRQVKGRKYDTVVIISPCHVDNFNFSSVMTEGSYKTPLGMVAIDSETAKQICAQSESIQSSQRGHLRLEYSRGEHALEIQLPFLQVALGEFKLVPIVMGYQSWNNCRELGEALGKVLKGKKALIVASTDLSHFHPYDVAKKMDEDLIELLEAYQPDEINRQLRDRNVEACGGGPVVAAMIAGKILGAEGLKALKYANSGDVPIGSKDSVVGYVSAIIYKKANAASSTKAEHEADKTSAKEGELTLTEKRQLMEIAKTTVNCVVKGQKVPEFKPVSETLKKERGAFVTLKIAGNLRGCIGYIIPVKPLYLTVQEVAESAALRDPRFPPVSISELPKLEYEISALSPIREIDDVKEIEVGKHGIIIKRGYHQGLLLPQVATEYGWDREEFLAHTCQKAGLPLDAWEKEGTQISIFSAEVFGEEDIK